MTHPGPPGEDERPLTGPDIGMGRPESGTQHATSTDFELPLDRPAEPDTDPLLTTPPRAQPTPPAYDDPAELVQPVEPTTTVPASERAGGLLGKVKAFADQRPAAFLAASLAAGWLVGKLLGSFGADDEDEDD
jgi:hypothetical protein